MLRPGLSGPFYFSLYELKSAICRQSNLLFCILRGILYNLVNVVLVAQLDRASASGAEGRGFDSRRAYHFFYSSVTSLFIISYCHFNSCCSYR